jgi:hypothetical protein
MISLQETTELYELGATWTAERRAVENDTIEDFSLSVAALLACLGEDREEDWWTRIVRPLKALRWRLATVPLPVNHPAVGVQEASDALVPLLRETVDTSPQTAPEAAAVADRLEHLWAAAADPLGDAVRSLTGVAAADTVAIVLTDARSSQAVEAAFTGHPVTTVAGLLRRTAQEVIAVGPSAWFDRKLLQAPRAGTFHFVYYAWLRDPQPQLDLMAHGSASLRCSIAPAPERPARPARATPVDPVEWVPHIEWDAVARAGRAGGPGGEPIEARLFTIASNEGIYLDARDGSEAFVAEVEDEITVRYRDVSEIRPGHYLIARTAGEADYIVPEADKLLGRDAKHLRALQHHMKDRLHAVAVELGVSGTARRLQALGSVRAADINNVRNWVSPRNIRTEDPSDFLAICRLIGEEDRFDSLWHAMGRVSSAHRDAGRTVRHRLVEELRKGDVIQLVGQGWADYDAEEIEGEGTLRVARVTGRAPDNEAIPRSRLRRLFSVSEDLWLG